MKEYRILKKPDHSSLEKEINKLADDGWKPISSWSHIKTRAGKFAGVEAYTHEYFCLLEKEIEDLTNLEKIAKSLRIPIEGKSEGELRDAIEKALG